MDGVILWEGQSKIDGGPIVALATGLQKGGANPKTGKMIQTWILRRDISPGEAARNGKDESVCGPDCIHRVANGAATCYVNLAWGPKMIWNAYRAGTYPKATAAERRHIRAGKLRLGAYGDPTAVPAKIWKDILPANPRDRIGYTHRWHRVPSRSYAKFLMASVETEAQLKEARRRGWRCFYTVTRNTSTLPSRVGWCPSDKSRPEPHIQCEDCGVCNGVHDGKRRADIAIRAHGAHGRTFDPHARRRPRARFTKQRPMQIVKHVQLNPDIHAEAKRSAKIQGKSLRHFVTEAISAKITEQRAQTKLPLLPRDD